MTGPFPRPLRMRILPCLPIIFCAAALALPLSATAEGVSVKEVQRIEELIAAVAHQTDAAFIRNNQTYDSTIAAEFLRLHREGGIIFIDLRPAIPHPVRRWPRDPMFGFSPGGTGQTPTDDEVT